MTWQFQLYRGDDQESIAVPVGDDWQEFAKWSSAQGGEAARLVLEGHTDLYRGRDAIKDLMDQLQDADYATAAALREALADDVEGVVLAEEGPARYGASQPAPDGKLHRDSFGYREAGGQPQRCENCRYYQAQDSELGQCIFFKSMMQAEPQRYELSAVVGPVFYCTAWEGEVV